MREKDSTMEDLSHQLQLWKTSLSSLKQEASEAKRRQSHVAECYGSFVNQLREEVHVFCMKTLKQSGPFPTVPSPPPEEVLKALKEKKNHLTLEHAKCQDSLKSNTLVKEKLETRLHQLTRDLSRSRSELTKATSQVCEQLASLKRMKVTLDRRGSMLTKIREEHAALKKQDGCRQQVLSSEGGGLLQVLHRVLQGAKTTPPAAAFSPHLSKDQEEHQWSRLTSAVLSMARSVGKELKTSREELAQVRTSLEKEKMTVLATRLAHKDLEAKLLRQLEDQEVTRMQRLQLVSSEYAQALSNLNHQKDWVLGTVPGRAQELCIKALLPTSRSHSAVGCPPPQPRQRQSHPPLNLNLPLSCPAEVQEGSHCGVNGKRESGHVCRARRWDYRWSVAVHIREPLSGGVKLGTQGLELDHLQRLQSEGVMPVVCKSLGELQSLLYTSLVSGVSHHDNNQTSRLHHLDNPALVVMAVMQE
ncbi:hypothetical protein EMCRGX_G021811 [Ephydatia muelleri]